MHRGGMVFSFKLCQAPATSRCSSPLYGSAVQTAGVTARGSVALPDSLTVSLTSFWKLLHVRVYKMRRSYSYD
eukprot:4277262-Amphidinium_carterae.1